jgi:hypothetical protein
MRRLVLILLLTLLPLQWTWAAAASLCAHEAESSAASAHFGHHAHEHQQDGGAESDDGIDAVDTDCPSCHGAVAGLVMSTLGALHDWLGAIHATPYRRTVTDGLPERLIRPPHSSPV